MRSCPLRWFFENGNQCLGGVYDSWPPKNTQAKTLYLSRKRKTFLRGRQERIPDMTNTSSDPNHPIPFVETQSTDVPQFYMAGDQRFRGKAPRCAGLSDRNRSIRTLRSAGFGFSKVVGFQFLAPIRILM